MSTTPAEKDAAYHLGYELGVQASKNYHLELERKLTLIKSQNRNIKRLQERNRLLGECLAEERYFRKEAYRWYMRRLNSKFFNLWDFYFKKITYHYRTYE